MDHYFSKRFIKQLFLELADSRLQNGAAALAFYSMLAIFPTAIFALSLLPYLPIPDLQRAIFDLLGQLMPREAAELFNDTVHKIVSERHSGLLSFGLLFAVWSATSGVLATLEQLDVVRREEHRRSSLRARGVAFLLLIPLSLLTLTTFGLVIFGGVLQGWIAGAQLRMSERTLNRRLNDAGTQFRSLLDDVRRERAQHLLQHTQLGISDIAQRLGVGDATAFGRAFRRCFGVSPSQFRAL